MSVIILCHVTCHDKIWPKRRTNHTQLTFVTIFTHHGRGGETDSLTTSQQAAIENMFRKQTEPQPSGPRVQD